MILRIVVGIVFGVVLLWLLGDALERADKRSAPWRRPGDGRPE